MALLLLQNDEETRRLVSARDPGTYAEAVALARRGRAVLRAAH